jgi:hypothetical protein
MAYRTDELRCSLKKPQRHHADLTGENPSVTLVGNGEMVQFEGGSYGAH